MAVSPPRPAGPPLNALRAFETAARLGGFAKAADELCVTPGAVAQHIKTLEAWAGAPLFERRSQGVRLTALGSSVISDFTSAFDDLGAAVQTLRSRATPKQIRIAALPSIAQLWLSPKLPAIRERTADFTVSITAMETPPNLKRDPYDLSIFFEEPPGKEGVTLIDPDVIFPVCSPAIAARLTCPADLASEICLHDATWSDDWLNWMEAASPGQPVDTQGPVFSLYSLAVEEARNGAGILIGHNPLVRRDLESGALVAPFDISVTLDRFLMIKTAQSVAAGSAADHVIKTLCP